jgi:glycopeptide antibiotics resistance protein
MRLSSYKNQLYNRINSNRIAFVYIPLGIYWVVLFILTTLPSSAMPSLGGVDKLEHFLAYTILGFMIGLAAHFQAIFHLNSRNRFLVVFSVTFTYAVLDELHQIPIKGRYFDWWDLFANFVGILIGLMVLRWFLSFKNISEDEHKYGTKG